MTDEVKTEQATDKSDRSEDNNGSLKHPLTNDENGVENAEKKLKTVSNLVSGFRKTKRDQFSHIKNQQDHVIQTTAKASQKGD